MARGGYRPKTAAEWAKTVELLEDARAAASMVHGDLNPMYGGPRVNPGELRETLARLDRLMQYITTAIDGPVVHTYCPACGHHGTGGERHGSFCPGRAASYPPAACPSNTCRIQRQDAARSGQ